MASGERCKFTVEEDELLSRLVKEYGHTSWTLVASMMNGRNERQCRDRWCNYLNPCIRNDKWTEEEDTSLRQLYDMMGPKWVKIAKHFPRRTDVMIKNRWNLLLRRDRRKIRISPTLPPPHPAEEKASTPEPEPVSEHVQENRQSDEHSRTFDVHLFDTPDLNQLELNNFDFLGNYDLYTF